MENHSPRPFFLIAAFATIVLGSVAQPPIVHPNFSGRWRMVKEKSDFHGFKMPDMVIRVVDHRDPVINLHTVQTDGKQTAISDVSYFTDNSISNNVIKGRDAQCRAYWDGQALVVRTKMIMANGEHEVIEDRWDLSADGKTLTTSSHVATESAEVNLTLVCEKEEAKQGQ